MKTKITVKWVAFENSSAVLIKNGRIGNAEMTFETDIPPAMYDTEILDLLYEQTNLYGGKVWDEYFDGKMPENRSHTALSVGDRVVIERNDDVSEYRCEDIGWELMTFKHLGLVK